MGRKKDHDYFAMLVEGVNYACEAATMLKTTFENFEPEKLQENINKVHHVEHTADMAKHDMMEKLVKEFITPIDREDILELADVIDDVTDDLEEILLKLYMYDIKELKEEALEFVDIIVRCCGEIKVMMEEFSNFRKSKAIGATIVSINDMEEEGDKLYFKAMHRLYANSSDPVELMKWTPMYEHLELCCDSCEKVAKVVERVILSNS